MKVTAREKMYLVVGGVAVVAILLFLLVDHWLKSQTQLNAEREQKELLLAKYQRIARKAPLLRQELEEIRTELGQLHQGLLKGQMAPLAAAELQRFLKDAASGVDLDIKRERIVEPVQNGPYQEIAVEINSMSSLTKLVEFLYQIETVPMDLKIKELQIRGDNFRTPRQMNTKLVVAGFISTSGGSELTGVPPSPASGSEKPLQRTPGIPKKGDDLTNKREEKP